MIFLCRPEIGYAETYIKMSGHWVPIFMQRQQYVFIYVLTPPIPEKQLQALAKIAKTRNIQTP